MSFGLRLANRGGGAKEKDGSLKSFPRARFVSICHGSLPLSATRSPRVECQATEWRTLQAFWTKDSRQTGRLPPDLRQTPSAIGVRLA